MSRRTKQRIEEGRGGGGTGAGSREEREREMYGKRDPQGSGKWEKSGTTKQRCIIFRSRKKSHKAIAIRKRGDRD